MAKSAKTHPPALGTIAKTPWAPPLAGVDSRGRAAFRSPRVGGTYALMCQVLSHAAKLWLASKARQ